MARRRRTRIAPALLLLPLLMPLGCMPAELSGEADPDTRRTLTQGEVVGFVHENGAHAWLGIPFAAPPVGELRWRAPRPPAPFDGTFEATAFGPSCPQFAPPGGGRSGDDGVATGEEDCLHLNVYAPPFAPEAVPRGGARLPVMVWIHGGGNTIGDAVLYDGTLIATRGNVVVVTVHYRLGVFGWLSHPALRDEGTTADDRSGNYGTLDLVRTLEVVEGKRLRSAMALGPFRFDLAFTLEPEDDGVRTRLSAAIAASNVVPVVGGALDRFAVRKLASEIVAQVLEDVRAHCERGRRRRGRGAGDRAARTQPPA